MIGFSSADGAGASIGRLHSRQQQKLHFHNAEDALCVVQCVSHW